MCISIFSALLLGSIPLSGQDLPAPADAKPAAAAASETTFLFDTAALNKIAGFEGEKLGSVYKFTLGRDDLHLTEMGAAINARMGLNSWAAFAGNEDDAQIAGDIAMRESEVNAVLTA